jgi:hypothetical protein
VAFAADGQVLASASEDGTVKLWDARTGQEFRTLRGHTGWVWSVAFAADSQVLASGSFDCTVKLWDARTGQELRTLRGSRGSVKSVAFAADGRTLWSRDGIGVLTWDVATGKRIADSPAPVFPTGRGDSPAPVFTGRGAPAPIFPTGSGAWSPDGNTFALGQANGLILLVPKAISESERRFRLLVTSPDLHLHSELAEAAERNKQPFAQAFRLGRYLAGKSYYAAEPKLTHEPPFADGLACTGVLYKQSSIAPARLLLGTARAVKEDASNWLNHAFHGGALYRTGEYAKALAELTEAVRLHGKPSPLTHNLLALTHLALGEKDKAAAARTQAQPGKGAPWEDLMLHRLFRPEVEAAFRRGNRQTVI